MAAQLPQPIQPHYKIQTLVSWEAPGRPFKKRSKSFFASILLLGLLVEIILFLFSQYTLMFVVVALIFVGFALSIVPPRNFHYRISTEGVMVEDHFFLWNELYDFYFKNRFGITVLHLRTQAFFPGEITVTLGDMSAEHIKSVIAHYLPYREYVKPTFMEKSADWLSTNFPLERDDVAHSQAA